MGDKTENIREIHVTQYGGLRVFSCYQQFENLKWI